MSRPSLAPSSRRSERTARTRAGIRARVSACSMSLLRDPASAPSPHEPRCCGMTQAGRFVRSRPANVILGLGSRIHPSTRSAAAHQRTDAPRSPILLCARGPMDPGHKAPDDTEARGAVLPHTLTTQPRKCHPRVRLPSDLLRGARGSMSGYPLTRTDRWMAGTSPAMTRVAGARHSLSRQGWGMGDARLLTGALTS
jgi:hypothetical protein